MVVGVGHCTGPIESGVPLLSSPFRERRSFDGE